MQDGCSLFFAMRTQWNTVASMAGLHRLGLKYEALEPTARAIGIELTDKGTIPHRVFLDVRALEEEAVTVWAEK